MQHNNVYVNADRAAMKGSHREYFICAEYFIST